MLLDGTWNAVTWMFARNQYNMTIYESRNSTITQQSASSVGARTQHLQRRRHRRTQSAPNRSGRTGSLRITTLINYSCIYASLSSRLTRALFRVPFIKLSSFRFVQWPLYIHHTPLAWLQVFLYLSVVAFSAFSLLSTASVRLFSNKN